MNNELKMNKSLILIISVWSNVLTPCPIAVNLRSLKKILQGGSIKTNVLEYRSSVRS